MSSFMLYIYNSPSPEQCFVFLYFTLTTRHHASWCYHSHKSCTTSKDLSCDPVNWTNRKGVQSAENPLHNPQNSPPT